MLWNGPATHHYKSYYGIISLRGEGVYVYETSLTPLHFYGSGYANPGIWTVTYVYFKGNDFVSVNALYGNSINSCHVSYHGG
jgi:hypothetical protein